jgi:hypothetical protein
MTKLRRILLLLALLTGVGAGVGYAATLVVSSTHLWAGTQSLTKSSCTLTGTSQTTDTYVDQSKATNQFGGAATMLVKPDATKQQWTFVRFDLSSCNIPTSGGADSATLSLFIKTAPTADRVLSVTPVTSTWASTLTWNSAQSLAYGSQTTTFHTGATNNSTVNIPVTIDVDALIKSASANDGWRISDGGSAVAGDATTFNTSSAGSGRPTLTINYEK